MDINTYISELPSVDSASFDEYVQLMQLYIMTAKKSDSFEGTKRLLTELYPDNAHFIFELLQNAEDAGATNVFFETYKDRLVFRHNGNRIFTLDDVKGITNIGNSTKKDDHTKVGKFGVGFKSVFAFTDTPRVYSDDYDFEIRDMLLPVAINSDELKKKKGETVFVFPFKGSKNDWKRYLDQIEKELCELDANTIMFLDNIDTINYSLSDGNNGYVSKSVETDNIYKIIVSSKHEESFWLIFEKRLLADEVKNKLHVNISFGLKKKNEGWRIVPVKGSVNIFFPAVMEKSGLRFNINGPFASTVARDSIRTCEDNNAIFAIIKELIKESLFQIKKKGMMDMGLYEVMPNNEDVLEGEYASLRDYIIPLFSENSLVLSGGHEYYKSTELIRTIPAVQDLFSFSTIKKMMDFGEKDWCSVIPQKNKNCRAFFESLNIRTFSYRSISKLFEDERRDSFERELEKKSLSWYRNFYLLLIDLNNYYQEDKLISQHASVISNIKRTRILLNDNDNTVCPKDIYVKTSNHEANPEIIVNRRLMDFEELKPFWGLMEIREYDEAATANEVLKQLERVVFPTEDYYEDILILMKSQSNIESIAERRIWFSVGEKEKHSAKELFIDLPYMETGYSKVACVTGKIRELSHSYYEKYKDRELNDFVAYVLALGIVNEIEIIKSDVKKNPLYHEVLYKYSDNVTALSTSEDYSIGGLEELLQSKNIDISRMLWNYMISMSALPRFCKASFSPNRTTAPRKCDSTLIQLFRDSEWLPCNQDGRYYKPSDMSRELLPEGFDWKGDALFLSLILFGMDRNRVKIQSEKLINDWGVDSESEQAKALRALLSNPQMAGQILNLVEKEDEKKYDLSEAISAQSRGMHIDDDEIDGEVSAVRNTERRAKKIEEELEAGLKKPALLKKLGLVARTIPGKEERLFLQEQYHGKCQICQKTIKKWNGKPYFEGINLVDTKRLDSQLKHSLEMGWNSLCLCPNHVAEYKYGAIDLSDIENEIENTDIIDGDDSKIALSIKMQGKKVDIMYSPKHFLALKTAFRFFKRNG